MRSLFEDNDFVLGAKGDGDVFDPDNIESLTDFVMAKTDNLGVHFMMADGVSLLFMLLFLYLIRSWLRTEKMKVYGEAKQQLYLFAEPQY